MVSVPIPGVLVLCLIAAAGTAVGQQPAPRAFVSHHQGAFNGRSLSYTAAAGETFLDDAAGKPAASIFSFAYTEDGVTDATARPVMFVFSGGPGSASFWQHIGPYGPQVRFVMKGGEIILAPR